MNEDHIQHDLAYRVYGRMDPETDRSKIDIWTILTIAQIIIKVVQAIKHCQENREGVIKTVKNPSIVQEAMLRAAVRKEMGFFKYFFRGGNDIVESIKQTAFDLDEGDMEKAGLFDRTV
tara:strand:+ start:279 stop:635 length:357 start_codon:yes stop_codon:yes gene_type:complete